MTAYLKQKLNMYHDTNKERKQKQIDIPAKTIRKINTQLLSFVYMLLIGNSIVDHYKTHTRFSIKKNVIHQHCKNRLRS